MLLNIYKNGKVVKTYEAETYDLMFGTVEDIFSIFDFDSLETGNSREIIDMLIKGVPKSMPMLKPLLKDIFEGLTDKELKNTKVKEIIAVLFELVKFSLSEMGKGIDTSKK